MNSVTKYILTLTFIIHCGLYSNAQRLQAKILNIENNLPIEYVNVGVTGKNIGTISNNDGQFEISIGNQNDNDTLKFSSIGYLPLIIPIREFKFQNLQVIYLRPIIYELKQVDVIPKKYRNKTFGNTCKTNTIKSGFLDNQEGFELGVLIKVNESALLKELVFNIIESTYDTILYRINIYEMGQNNEFKNILEKPIYLKLEAKVSNERKSIDLKKYNIRVKSDFLITLEHIKDSGKGQLYYSASYFDCPTYYRNTNQESWIKSVTGLWFNVAAMIEK